MRSIPSRALVVGAIAVATLACASGGGTTGSPRTPNTVRVETGAGALELGVTNSDPTSERRVSGEPGRIWAALPAVFEELGVPVTTNVTASRMMGNTSHRVRGRQGGARISRNLYCGERMGVQNADSYEIVLRLLVQLRPADGQTAVVTSVEGTARPMATSGNEIHCSTTGQLDDRIVQLLTNRASS